MTKKSKTIQEYLKRISELYCYLKHGLSEDMPIPPEHIYIEPTNICNLNCLHCARWAIKREKQNMESDVFSEALRQIKGTGWNPRITLTGQGEPLLHKEIIRFIKMARKSGFFVSMITNGTVLNEEMGRKIIESGLNRIQFSFDSIIKETYEKIRRGANYKKTLENILRFLEVNEKLGHPCYASVSSVQSREVAKQKEKFLEFWRKYPIDNVYLTPLSTLQGKSNLEKEAKKSGKQQLCILPWLNLSIKMDGSIVACPHDYDNSYVLGNVVDDNISQIWNGDRIKFLRKSILNSDFKFFKKIGHDCEKCNNYLIGYGLEDYLGNYFLRIEKNLEPYFVNYDKKEHN